MRPLTVGSLFAGIGGFDLGLERAGMRSVWQCEIDPYAIRVLEKHWPDVLRVRDVRDVTAATVPYVDVICGGFPCQDLSLAGRGAGLAGARSGLWSEYARIVGELRPRYVIVENVRALLVRGLDRVLGDLAALGYDAEWDCIPASAVGAPHQRDRIWIVAYPDGSRRRPGLDDVQARQPDGGTGEQWPRWRAESADRCGGEVPDAHGQRRDWRRRERSGEGEGGPVDAPAGSGPWAVEPDVGRMAHGVPARSHRLAALGNALVPQIPEWIGRRILDWERVS